MFEGYMVVNNPRDYVDRHVPLYNMNRIKYRGMSSSIKVYKNIVKLIRYELKPCTSAIYKVYDEEEFDDITNIDSVLVSKKMYKRVPYVDFELYINQLIWKNLFDGETPEVNILDNPHIYEWAIRHDYPSIMNLYDKYYVTNHSPEDRLLQYAPFLISNRKINALEYIVNRWKYEGNSDKIPEPIYQYIMMDDNASVRKVFGL